MILSLQFKKKIEILTTLLFLFLYQFTWSQNASQYVFSLSNGTYTALTSPTVLTSGASVDNSVNTISSGSLSGFAFIFGGTSYTSFTVSSNGFIGFGGSAPSASLYTPLSTTGGGNVFASASAADLSGIDANTLLSWKLEGASPNRELVFEWKNFKHYGQTSVLNFQIRLQETTNLVSIVYGSMSYASTTSKTVQIGLKSSTTAGHYSNRTTTSNWNATTAGVANTASCTLLNTVTMPTSGLTFTWSMPSCFTLPTSLASSNITTSSASTSWTAPSPAPAMGYDYELRTSGAAGSGAAGLISSGTTAAGVTTKSFTGLTGNTSHSLYVRSRCDASTTSAWTSALVFSTAKNEPTNQLTNLVAGTVTTTAIPLAWTAAVAGSQLPDGYFIRASSVDLASIPDPVDGTDLTDVTTFSSGAANKKQTTGTATSTTTFSGMTAGTMYYYKAFSYTNTGTAINFNTTSAPTLFHATLPSVVTTLAFSSTTANGSTLSWALPSGYDATKHQVLVFLKSGSSITTGTPTSLPSSYTASSQFGLGSAYQNDTNAKAVYNGDGTTVTISELNSSTAYYALVYVVMESANSNGNASYSTSNTSNTTTTCASATLPLAQGFNATTIPSCWTQQSVIGATALTFPISAINPVIAPQEGSDFVYWNSFNATSGNQTRLISQPINSNGLLGAGLRFYWFHDNSAYITSQYIGEGVKVQYSTNGTTWTDVQAIDRLLTGTNGWTLYDINLPAGAVNQNNLYIGFLFTSKLGNNCALDNVTVYAATGCLVPSNLSSSSITANSANVTFTAPLSVPSNGYDVYYSTTNVAPASNATPNIDNSNTTTISLSGLTGNTTYYWWVRSDCNSDISTWVSGGSFTTLKSEPTNQLTNLAAGSVTTTAIPLAWTAAVAGSQLPDGYLIRASSVDLASISDPVDGTDLTDVTTFTSGAANKKQTTGTASSTTTFSGMTSGTMYYYKAYSFTNTGTGINYNTTSAPTFSHATLPSSATALAFSATTFSGSTLSWSLPAGYDASKHQILVFLKSGSSVTTGTPTSLPSSYTASSQFGLGTAYQNDASAFAVYSGDSTSMTVSGLNISTTYYALVYVVMESANSNGNASYSSSATSSVGTLKSEPTNQLTNLAAGTVTTTAIPLAWTAAAAGSQLPDGYLIRSSSVDLASIPDPVDGTDLTDVTTFTSGAANKKQTTGTATSTSTFSGMTSGTMYYYKAYSYTNTGTAINYNTTSAPTLSYATLPSSATAFAFSATTANGSTLSWSLPAGYDASKHQILVFLKSGSTITSGTPTSLSSSYTASSQFGLGSAYQNDANAKAVYSGDGSTVTISDLTSATTYYALVYVVMENANSNGTASYSASTTANMTTPCSAITSYPSSEAFASYLPTCWTEGDGGDLTTGPTTTFSVNDPASLWSPDDYLNSGTTTLGSAKINIYQNVVNDWLISPSYTLSSVYRLKYSVGATEWDTTTALVNAWESDDYVQLLVNEIGTSAWSVLKTYNNTNVPSYVGQIDTFDLSSYQNKTVRFAFRAVEGASNGSADIDFFIDNFTVELPPAEIVITPSGSTTICSGSSVSLDASSTEVYSYTWTPSTGLSATTGSTVIASPTVTTTYTVTGVNGSVNTTKTITVTVTPNADTITVPSSYTVCSDSSIALVASLPPTSLVIGSGTTAGTSNNSPYRFNISTANSSRVQYLITKSELNALGLNTAGFIRSLGFNVVTLVGTTTSSYEIKMANVANTSLTSTYLTPTFTTVFSNSVTLTTGLNTHTFTTPFYWDGTSNVVINICHNSPNTGNTLVAVSTPAQTSTISGSGTTQCTTTTGATNASRPVMTLGINNNLRTVTWSPSTGLYLDNLGTQPYAGESNTTVYYKGSTNTTYTVTNTSGSCSNQASTSVNVIAQPIAEITGNVTICNGSSTDLLFTGTANATITYSNGVATNTVTLNDAGTASVTVSPTATTTYTLVSVNTATVPVCMASLTGSITVTVQALPTASVTAASGVICQGSSAVFNISGTNGSVVSYTINGGSVATTTLVDGVSQISVDDVSSAQVIQLVSVSFANCIQNLSGQATVEMGTVASLTTISDVYVDATTKKYMVTAIPNVQTYEWTLPSSVGLISSNTLGNEIIVSIPTNYVAGDGILSVKAIGTCGTSNVITRTITPITPTITGLSVICPDTTTSVNYQAPIISGATYNWVLPAGMSLSSGAGTSSITVGVNSTFQSGYVSLTISTSERTYTNRLIVGRIGSPAVINGPVSLCATTTATYTVDAIADAQSYVWDVPAGVSIVSGSGSNSISVTVSPTFVTGTIKVFAVGPCGSGLARSLVVSRTPGAINLNGPKSICGQSTASHSITSGVVTTTLNSVFIYATSALNGVSSFLWTVPTGATIVQGQGTSMIYVSYSNDFISGSVLVVPQVSCGSALAKSITVNNSVVAISGPSDLCGLSEAIYSMPSTAGTNFVWTLPAGMQLISGAGTSTIKVSISATCLSSMVSVTYQSSCSNNGLTATKTVGCAIQSALYPSFCGATLPSMGSTLIANEIAGATKYKFTVQNGATTYSYESLTRFFKLTDLNVALLYATPYTVKVGVLINNIWYNSACGCVITTPSIGGTKLISNQCNSILYSFTSIICADFVSNASEYMFEVVGPGVSVSHTSNLKWFRLSQITSVQFAYGTVYSIRVKVKIGGQWGSYGETCTVTTPSVPSTNVISSQCGTTLNSMSTAVVANLISGATSYKFEITGSSFTTEYTTNARWFKFSDLTGVTVLYGSAYTIRVKVLINGQWGTYSSSCVVTTPSIPTTKVMNSQCGSILTKLNGSISANIVPLVSQYMFEITSGSSVFEYSTANRWFRLTDVVGLGAANNNSYSIRVRVMLNGQWGSYGVSCNVTTPVASTTSKDNNANQEVKEEQESSIVLYPNPFVDYFSIGLEGYSLNEAFSVSVFDISGKQVYSNNMTVSELQVIQLGKDLPSGMYLLRLESSTVNKTYKLVKK